MIKIFEFGERKIAQPIARQPRRNIERHFGRFDEEGAAAAHRIQKCFNTIPAGQFDNARGEIFFQWRFAGVVSQAALEQRLSGKIDIQRRMCGVQKSVNADIRRARIHRWTRVHLFAKFVADRVLDSECNEIEAL